ncbi:MAG: DUF3592 domain-containing protein [Rhodanobacteraceae bacterium]|nr:DUF3592 domain-containing protein [Rhodanobacteraceae bacterium]
MRWFIVIFGLVGLAMAVADFFVIRHTLNFRDGAVTTEGEVIDFVSSRGSKGGTMYAPRVRYSVPLPEGGAGASYEIVGSVRSSSRGYDVGEKVKVLFRPDRPADGQIGSFMEQWFVATILSVFTLVFGGVAIGMIVSAIRRKRMYDWLEHSGMTVQARIVEVGKNTSLKVNGRSPWVIRAQWQHPVTSKVHMFQSENLWFDPSEFIGDREQIGIRIDADQPERHRVDISWLPKSA